ncbi:hypothetical protein FRC0182_00631 [Corynebacterium diphtheriae]|nr:hypothetical protein FRC0182_00631 [Corynebacterium diphtheriae]
MAKREVKFKHVKKTRLSDEQLEKLTALQQVLGCSDAEILRMAVETFVGKLSSHTLRRAKDLPPGVSKQLSELTRAVNAVGVNVNQSTRVMHALIADGLMPAETQDYIDISMAKFCMDSIQQDVEKIRQEVNNFVLHESPAQ